MLLKEGDKREKKWVAQTSGEDIECLPQSRGKQLLEEVPVRS